jgi:hypothetical protein
LIIVAPFRTHNAEVTRRKFLETGIAIPLAETLVGLPAAVLAVYDAVVLEFDGLTQKAVQGKGLVSQSHIVGDC